MKREIRITEDGSHTVYVKEMEEPYHSIHGAVQESMHVFINQGFNTFSRKYIRILELGFGTGLNALLTLLASLENGKEVYYHTVEKYPLEKNEYELLNFQDRVKGIPEGSLRSMHEAAWEQPVRLNDNFTLFKEHADFRSMNPDGIFDLVYFDAFDPNKQPDLWTEDIFTSISSNMASGSILLTYSSKGVVRRAMKASGLEVRKVPGPPGKREMIRAIRI